MTGAGVSQESGIPTFRGDGGLWRTYDPMELATISAFERDPALVWQWYDERRANIASAEPNAGHRAVAEMAGVREVEVATQNIDGLHQRAGSSGVLELHGSIVRTRCSACGAFSGRGAGLPPRCRCGGIQRPDVVWFGEPLPPRAWEGAVRAALEADLMVVAGTSLAVWPANTLPERAKSSGAMLVEVNPERTAMSGMMDLSLQESASSALPEILRLLQGQSPAGSETRMGPSGDSSAFSQTAAVPTNAACLLR